MPIRRRSPARGDNTNAPRAVVVADFWSKKTMLPTPPLQKTAISAAHVVFAPPKSCTRPSGFLVGAIEQAATGTVVATDRNRQLSARAVAYPATRLLVTTTGARPAAVPADAAAGRWKAGGVGLVAAPAVPAAVNPNTATVAPAAAAAKIARAKRLPMNPSRS